MGLSSCVFFFLYFFKDSLFASWLFKMICPNLFYLGLVVVVVVVATAAAEAAAAIVVVVVV